MSKQIVVIQPQGRVDVYDITSDLLRLLAQDGAQYQIIEAETGLAPERVYLKRSGEDLEIRFDEQLLEPDLLITHHFRHDNSPLLGEGSNGEIYAYTPEMGLRGMVDSSSAAGVPYSLPRDMGMLTASEDVVTWRDSMEFFFPFKVSDVGGAIYSLAGSGTALAYIAGGTAAVAVASEVLKDDDTKATPSAKPLEITVSKIATDDVFNKVELTDAHSRGYTVTGNLTQDGKPFTEGKPSLIKWQITNMDGLAQELPMKGAVTYNKETGVYSIVLDNDEMERIKESNHGEYNIEVSYGEEDNIVSADRDFTVDSVPPTLVSWEDSSSAGNGLAKRDDVVTVTLEVDQAVTIAEGVDPSLVLAIGGKEVSAKYSKSADDKVTFTYVYPEGVDKNDVPTIKKVGGIADAAGNPLENADGFPKNSDPVMLGGVAPKLIRWSDEVHRLSNGEYMTVADAIKENPKTLGASGVGDEMMAQRGDRIYITLHFDRAVEINTALPPTLTVDVDYKHIAQTMITSTANAHYVSGSKSKELVFVLLLDKSAQDDLEEWSDIEDYNPIAPNVGDETTIDSSYYKKDMTNWMKYKIQESSQESVFIAAGTNGISLSANALGGGDIKSLDNVILDDVPNYPELPGDMSPAEVDLAPSNVKQMTIENMDAGETIVTINSGSSLSHLITLIHLDVSGAKKNTYEEHVPPGEGGSVMIDLDDNIPLSKNDQVLVYITDPAGQRSEVRGQVVDGGEGAADIKIDFETLTDDMLLQSFIIGDKKYSFLDFDGDGKLGDLDRVSHDTLDKLFNNGADTDDSNRTADSKMLLSASELNTEQMQTKLGDVFADNRINMADQKIWSADLGDKTINVDFEASGADTHKVVDMTSENISSYTAYDDRREFAVFEITTDPTVL